MMKTIVTFVKNLYDSFLEARRLEEEYYESTNKDAYHKVNMNKFM